MSVLPKQLPFDKIGLQRTKNLEELKKWMEQFLNDFELFYSKLYNQIENKGASTAHWRVIEVSDKTLEFQYWDGTSWIKKGAITL
jgi:hypothetical protein